MNETLAIGKYTFGVSFIIGNIFLFGSIISNNSECTNFCVVGGYIFLFIASAINILVLIGLSVYCLWIKENYKNYLKAAGYILLNIPIAALYVYIGFNVV